MDRYTHLQLAGVAGALDRLPDLPRNETPDPMQATGTDNTQAHAAEFGCGMVEETASSDAHVVSSTGHEASNRQETSEPCETRDLCRISRGEPTLAASSGGGTRTPDTRIMIPHESSENAKEKGILRAGAAQSTAVATDDPDLATVIQAWHSIPDAVKSGIVAMLRATLR